MKAKQTLLNTKESNNGKSDDELGSDSIGDDHISTSIDTPMREDAFDKDDEEKIKQIEEHFRKIMEILGLDLEDDSLSGTPQRVAKMYVKEVFTGLNPENKPDVKVFENKYHYKEMLIEKNITLYSFCEHHFLPIIGKAHVGYISNGNVVGLSKINRIVNYYAKRPQVQERLSLQILKEMKNALKTDDVAVLIESKHLCVNARGVKDDRCSTLSAEYSGKFSKPDIKSEFLQCIGYELK